mmetsp:Transcript_12809/g.39811  ORF Transcript_12809/g.39811 Transcript_12809/m.39811 type:complete len:391 (-) Transcript_12809:21-1193(-)
MSLVGEEMHNTGSHDTCADDTDRAHLGDLVLGEAGLLLHLLHAVVKEVQGALVLGLRGDHELGEQLRLTIERGLARVRGGVQDGLQCLVLAKVLTLRHLVQHLDGLLLNELPSKRVALEDLLLKCPPSGGLRHCGAQRLVDELACPCAHALVEAVLGGEAILARHNGVDDTGLTALVGLVLATLQNPAECGLDPSQLLEAHGATRTRQEAKEGLGEAHGRLVRDDTVVAGKGEFAPTTERETVHRSNDRVLGAFDAVEEVLARLGRGLGHRLVGHRVQLLQISAHAEGILRRSDDCHARFLLLDKFVDGVHSLFQRRHELVTKRVGAGRRAVHDKPREHVGVDVNLGVIAGLDLSPLAIPQDLTKVMRKAEPQSARGRDTARSNAHHLSQ